VQHSVPLQNDQLVSVTQYHRERIGPPLAVGRMAVTSDVLREADTKELKGKAVYVLHTWKDCLWDMGISSKQDIPEPREISRPEQEENPENEVQEHQEEEYDDVEGLVDEVGKLQLDGSSATRDGTQETSGEASEAIDVPEAAEGTPSAVLSPEGRLAFHALKATQAEVFVDISSCLRSALLQALQTTLASAPSSTYPIPASTFWSNYVLPARPVQPMGADVTIGGSCVCTIISSSDKLRTRYRHHGYQTVYSQVCQSVLESLCKGRSY
jgi:translation initiation factor 2D